YQTFAYFNNVPEKGKAIKYGNSPPYIKTPTRTQAEKLGALYRNKVAAEHRFAELQSELAKAQAAWEDRASFGPRELNWAYQRGLRTHLPLLERDPNKIVLHTPGRMSDRCAKVFDGGNFIDAGNVGNFGFFDKFSISVWAFPQGKRGGTIVSRM